MIDTELIRSLAPNESLITVLLSECPGEVKKFVASMDDLEALMFEYDWEYRRRPMQIAPAGDWDTWVLQGGRGVGKTRPGSEQIIAWAKELGQDYGGGHIALIAKDPADARDVMIEGDSGIMPCSPPYFRPRYEPSKRRLTWPNGVMAHVYSGEVPDDLRGPQHHKGWVDEFCKMKYPLEVWDMYTFGLRLGEHPQTVLTTTPRPIQVFMDILKEPGTVVTKGKTDDNYANLSPKFIERVYKKYKGTRLGRQELDAELLMDAPGALWNLKQLDALRVRTAPPLIRIVVAIDPSGSDKDSAAECGIVIAGVDAKAHGYVIGDKTDHMTPATWGGVAVEEYENHKADRIVGEQNFGGQMVDYVVRSEAQLRNKSVAYKAVTASRGKLLRAEPVSALYEQGRGHHVGAYPALEDEMCTWQPGMKSPNRLDALVWAFTELLLDDNWRPAGDYGVTV